jgi:uncharacterized protein with NRDE domain
MCTIYFAYQTNPDFPLILLANRDEAYNRQSIGMHLWPETDVFSGLDLKGGGIWTGINKRGYLGCVTNYRDMKAFNPDSKSRGHLIKDYLLCHPNEDDFKKKLMTSLTDYNLYNLIYGHFSSLKYFSNVTKKVLPILPGIHGLSNHLLDTPWVKVARGKMRLDELLKSEGSFKPDDLFEILDDRTKSYDKLPLGTGLSEDEEYRLSSTFIDGIHYGTQYQTVIIIDRHNFIQIHEKKWTPQGWLYKKIMFKLEEQHV